ncbi:FAD-dependent oxidoreductase [Pikeienuella piscinae]|uniref:FAD-dependent oxidoreductase n=1 Tax=Pikeienuella piscinae TaxID=2748098 RepID=A0A7L5BUP6_9RHOB|nr:FAD-dependent oxidoreductase [Pikeienuella piscinae]QIE54458.1 FAD-dependent oxidoreductase [Pikeienuella piscinae]
MAATDEQSARPHVAVVGAGIVGVATSIWLRRAGARVTLIDREGPATGTSYGNAGILAAASVAPVTVPGLLAKAPGMLFDPMKPLFLRWSYLPRLAPWLRRYLAHGNEKAVERISHGLTELLGDTVDQHISLAAGTDAARFVKPVDYLYGYDSRADHDADSYSWSLRARRGFAFEEMDAAAIAAFDPALKGRFGFAVRCPGHGMISDPGAYVRALHAHLVDIGGQSLTATVSDIRVEQGRATGVVTDAGVIAADEVALTAGAWSGPIAKRLGVTMPLETERGYHVEFVDPSIELRAPVMVASGKFVATPMEGRLRCAGVVEFGGLDAPPSEAPFRMVEKKARALFPDLEYSETRRWMGHRPATTDSLPVIGRAPAAINVWLGYGHQHVGLTGGPKTGRWLASLICGERLNVDLAPFAPDRAAVVKT